MKLWRSAIRFERGDEFCYARFVTAQQRLSGEAYPLKLSAKEFLALAEAGLFDGYARTELIEGEVWTMNAVWRWHARAQMDFGFAIRDALRTAGLDLVVYGAGSVIASEDSVPEPDIIVALDEPRTREPISLAAVRIAIELSDTTREMDLGRKARLYARHGIPEYWVVDRETQAVVRHASPGVEGYADVVVIAFVMLLSRRRFASSKSKQPACAIERVRRNRFRYPRRPAGPPMPPRPRP